MVRVKIPATTANMGPGFDVLGMALKLYNYVEIEETDEESKIFINGEESELDYKNHLVYKTLTKVLDNFKYKYNGFNINMEECNIPMSRGLGSSAACIVSAVVSAGKIMNREFSKEDIINIATEIEGHPDNVVPATVGGMVISLMDENKINYSKVKVPEELKFVVMIPSFKVDTEESRDILPKSYDKKDCIYNISRSSMLISSLYNKEYDKLRLSFDDKIHQPYRKKLIQDSEYIFEKSKEFGAIGEFISGSGSTLISVIYKDEEKFMNSMKNILNNGKKIWNIKLLEPDLEGVQIV